MPILKEGPWLYRSNGLDVEVRVQGDGAYLVEIDDDGCDLLFVVPAEEMARFAGFWAMVAASESKRSAEAAR